MHFSFLFFSLLLLECQYFTLAADSNRQVVSFVDVAKQSFLDHPLHLLKEKSLGLVDYLVFIANQDACRRKPVFMTMARVQDPLYWQLIEGFFHSMFYFDHLSCSIMICVSDPNCMKLCEENGYPCYNYQHHDAHTHVMEQVADLKLKYVGMALEAGVTILLLDLDVGFIQDPIKLYEGFQDNPLEQLRAQMDVNSCMNKSAGNTWFTQPLTNFGVFLVKPNPYSVKVFKQANKQYKRVPAAKRTNVATDQNVIGGAIKWGRWRFGYNFSYFSIGFNLGTRPRPILPQKVLLLHHIGLIPTVRGTRFQLGGEVAQEEIGDAIGVHATCYEKSTKLYGLKASNAYWNFVHYDPNRATITKPLMLHSKRQLRQEIALLAYLAISTKRALLIPNVLIGVGKGIPGQITGEALGCREDPYMKTSYCQEIGDYRNTLESVDNTFNPEIDGEYYWPGFRVVDERERIPGFEIIESGYYFRIQQQNEALRTKGFKNANAGLTSMRESFDNIESREDAVLNMETHTSPLQYIDTPDPFIFQIDMADLKKHSNNEKKMLQIASDLSGIKHPRVVLDVIDSSLTDSQANQEHNRDVFRGGPADLVAWAASSVNNWLSGADGKKASNSSIKKYTYVPLSLGRSSLQFHSVYSGHGKIDFSDDIKLCKQLLVKLHGNRSCFSICK